MKLKDLLTGIFGRSIIGQDNLMVILSHSSDAGTFTASVEVSPVLIPVVSEDSRDKRDIGVILRFSLAVFGSSIKIQPLRTFLLHRLPEEDGWENEHELLQYLSVFRDKLKGSAVLGNN